MDHTSSYLMFVYPYVRVHLEGGESHFRDEKLLFFWVIGFMGSLNFYIFLRGTP